MSYCRWSSDWFRCDLYAYESDRGFEIHVGGRRHKATDNLPPEFDQADEEDERMTVTRYLNLHMKVMALIADHADENYRTLGLPHDGESFILPTEREMYAKILELEALGYRIPRGLHDEALEATRSQP